jgi:tRNA (adenine22-N1)-methyltransferase
MVKLSKRLNTAGELVHNGARLADVGCDHGYVPVSLLEQKKIISAIACDINVDPLASCKRLVDEYSYSDKIKCVLSNGLQNVNGNEIDDILIAGMGGELIADILDNCTYVKEKHLVLNPMTHPEIARKWLYDNGFEIINDIVVADGRHHYSVFDAEYTGQVATKTQADYYLGNITDFSDKDYFLHLLSYLKNKQKGGHDFADLIKTIEEKL